MTSIKILKRKEVDEHRWNAVVEASAVSLPYAYTWYLDAVAENWEALVLGDYEAIMPLVWLRKLGIKYLYQPYYCQQLGVFSARSLSAAVMKEMLMAAGGYAYININLNLSAKAVADDFKLKPKKNLLLDLSKNYTALQKKYAENHRRNIAKAEKAGLQFAETGDVKQFQKFYLQNINRDKENFKPQHEKLFKTLTKAVTEKQKGRLFAAADANSKLVAVVLLLTQGNRLIAVVNNSSEEGKKLSASHFLFDRIIRQFAGTGEPFILDFEGSSVPGIARFYQGFGAYEEVFYNYHTTLIKKLAGR